METSSLVSYELTVSRSILSCGMDNWQETYHIPPILMDLSRFDYFFYLYPKINLVTELEIF